MSLETAILKAAKKPGGTCGVRILLDQMTPEDAATLRRMMAAVHPTVDPDTKPVHVHSAQGIATGLKEELALIIKHDTIQRHRIGSCACDAV